MGLGDGKAADVDQIIGNDPKANPAFHAVVATIAATLQAMSTLADTDASSHALDLVEDMRPIDLIADRLAG